MAQRLTALTVNPMRIDFESSDNVKLSMRHTPSNAMVIERADLLDAIRALQLAAGQLGYLTAGSHE